MTNSPLLDALGQPEPPKKSGVKCRVHSIMQLLPPQEKELVQARIDELRTEKMAVGLHAQTSFTARWLADVLTQNGYPVSARVMRDHTRRACSCGY